MIRMLTLAKMVIPVLESIRWCPFSSRERLLLVDPVNSTVITKQLVALVVGELAARCYTVQFSLH